MCEGGAHWVDGPRIAVSLLLFASAKAREHKFVLGRKDSNRGCQLIGCAGVARGSSRP